MKANDLMIGDWVQVAKDVCIKKGTIVKVRSIDGDNSFPEKGLKGCATCEPIDDRTISGGVWVEYLEPIPLTPEILEKNGFIKNVLRKNVLVYVFSDNEDYYTLVIDEYSDSIWRLEYTNNEFNTPITRIMFSYVHELQHALRLCGIDKEIVL